MPGRPVSHERRVLSLALLLALPGIVATLVLLWSDAYAPAIRGAVSSAILITAGLILKALRQAVRRPLETLGNVLAALREGDFSMRFHPSGHPEDPLDHVAREVNALSSTLRAQRLGAAE